ncbi:MAG: TonB-dependent receptor [Kofleriaceae bacterium]
MIVVDTTWPGVELVDAEHTARATSSVVPSDTRAAATLADHLAQSSGVAVQRTGPGQGVPIVRGLIGSAVLVLVDGIRLNNAIFRPAPNQYTSLIDPWWIDGVTVIKGPGSAPFGSDALGGVIAVTTPLPVFSSSTWTTRPAVDLALSSADRSTAARAALAIGRTDIGVSAALSVEDHGDLRNGDGVRQTPSAYRAYGAQLTAHIDRGRHATTAWLQLYEQPELPRTDELRPGYGQDVAASEVWAYRPSRRLLAHVRELVRAPWGLDGLELHAAYQRVDDHRRIRDTGATEELREQIVDHGVTALARGAASRGPLALLAGLELQHDRVACERQLLDVVSGDAAPAPCRFADGSTMTQLGAFAEARRPLGERVELRAGTRVGAAALRIAGDAESSATVDTLDWAAELSVELRATSSVSFVGNVGRGFRAPNVNDLAGLGPRPGNRFQQPSSTLRDERALGADVGVRARTPRARAEAYVFALRHDDRIDVVPTGMLTESGRQIVVSDNIGTTRTVGVEAAAELRPHEEVALRAAATWIRGTKDDGDGEEPADRIPPLGGIVAVRWTPIARLGLDAELAFAGTQRRLSARDREDPRIDPTGTDRFVTFGIGARYAWSEVSVAARIENLGDRQYRQHASGVDAPGIDARLLVQWRASYGE